MRRGGSSAIYDEIENRIITFGGYKIPDFIYVSDLYSYELENSTWTEITPESYFVPPGIALTKLFLRSDRILLSFYGNTYENLISEIYSYDLSTNVWTTVTLSGDYISARTEYAFTSFTYLNNEYIAIYGGLTKSGVSDELFL